MRTWMTGPAAAATMRGNFLNIGLAKKGDPPASRQLKQDIPVRDVEGWQEVLRLEWADGAPRSWARFCAERFDRGSWVLLNTKEVWAALHGLVRDGIFEMSDDCLFRLAKRGGAAPAENT